MSREEGSDIEEDAFNDSDFDSSGEGDIQELDVAAEIELLDKQAQECDDAVGCGLRVEQKRKCGRLWLRAPQAPDVAHTPARSLGVSQGDAVKALYYREQALVRRQDGNVSDEEFGDFCYMLAVQYNSVAMASLREGECLHLHRSALSVRRSVPYMPRRGKGVALCLVSHHVLDADAGSSDEALTMLKKAEVLTSAKGLFRSSLHRAKLRALTFNNFGCVYKLYARKNPGLEARYSFVPLCCSFHPSCGRLHTALRYLDKALHIESVFSACDNPAGTHLNVCAILSQMGRYVVQRRGDSSLHNTLLSDVRVCLGHVRATNKTKHRHRGALHHADFALEILLAERMLKKQVERDAAKEKKRQALRKEKEQQKKLEQRKGGTEKGAPDSVGANPTGQSGRGEGKGEEDGGGQHISELMDDGAESDAETVGQAVGAVWEGGEGHSGMGAGLLFGC